MSVLQMVSLLMIGIAAWGKWFGLVSSFQVVGGIIGVGVFLFFVALAGLIGAMKHHQVLLFFVSFTNSSYDSSFCTFIHNFYKMTFSFMFLLTLLKDHLLEVGWNNSESTQRDVEKSLNCCGFKHVDPNSMCEAVSLDQVFSKCSPLHVTYLSLCKQADDGSVF
ncbi:tetraspanin-13-like [Neolamprologus brichardi]|uniref:tetraspanin-13-like n=1 Tax=Neolamprologus brichardi TaxID=32507 RepID=UPI0016436BB5|nr:tetraspanin-13-like [Neolamprologus brichardi]